MSASSGRKGGLRVKLSEQLVEERTRAKTQQSGKNILEGGVETKLKKSGVGSANSRAVSSYKHSVRTAQ